MQLALMRQQRARHVSTSSVFVTVAQVLPAGDSERPARTMLNERTRKRGGGGRTIATLGCGHVVPQLGQAHPIWVRRRLRGLVARHVALTNANKARASAAAVSVGQNERPSDNGTDGHVLFKPPARCLYCLVAWNIDT